LNDYLPNIITLASQINQNYETKIGFIRLNVYKKDTVKDYYRKTNVKESNIFSIDEQHLARADLIHLFQFGINVNKEIIRKRQLIRERVTKGRSVKKTRRPESPPVEKIGFIFILINKESSSSLKQNSRSVQFFSLAPFVPRKRAKSDQARHEERVEGVLSVKNLKTFSSFSPQPPHPLPITKKILPLLLN